MSWTDITRAEHNRNSDRYPPDLTNAEWAVALPLVPGSRPGGRSRTSDMREVMNAILYIADGDIPWRMPPKDFPPVSTVRGYFYRRRSSLDGLTPWEYHQRSRENQTLNRANL